MGGNRRRRVSGQRLLISVSARRPSSLTHFQRSQWVWRLLSFSTLMCVCCLCASVPWGRGALAGDEMKEWPWAVRFQGYRWLHQPAWPFVFVRRNLKQFSFSSPTERLLAPLPCCHLTTLSGHLMHLARRSKRDFKVDMSIDETHFFFLCSAGLKCQADGI